MNHQGSRHQERHTDSGGFPDVETAPSWLLLLCLGFCRSQYNPSGFLGAFVSWWFKVCGSRVSHSQRSVLHGQVDADISAAV